MKVLIVNKFYYPRGGDCVCAINLERLLRENGHETAVFAMDYAENVAIPAGGFAPEVSFSGSISSKIKAAKRIFGGAGVRDAFTEVLQRFRPDVVHFHNIHSYLSPAIVKMAKDFGAKTVWTMHDYKLVCPSYACLSNGKPCEDCIGGSKKQVFSKRCMKGSRAASLLAWMEACHWNAKKLSTYTDCFICPSAFMSSKMEKGGFDEKKLAVVTNFVDPQKVPEKIETERKPYYVYAGRLSQEKGLLTLLKAAVQFPYPLKIAGDGPLREELETKFGRCDNIEFLGHLNAESVGMLMRDARFSVTPSECYDNNPLSVIESLSAGTPVVGARIGGIPELIQPGCGLLFRSGNVDLLANSIAQAWEYPFDYAGIAANAASRFSRDRYLKEILAIYR